MRMFPGARSRGEAGVVPVGRAIRSLALPPSRELKLDFARKPRVRADPNPRRDD